MKAKMLGILTMLLLTVVAYVPATFAVVPTDFTMTWNGFGVISSTFTAGDDAVAGMGVTGYTSGSFVAQDTDVAPYSYGVDDSSAYMRGDIGNALGNGGSLTFTYNRIDSYTPMYGSAGQESYSYVGSTGTGSLDFRTGSNYAALGSANYGFQSDSQFTASGDFLIQHSLNLSGPNGAQIVVDGIGTADIDHMSDDALGDSFKFGAGAGCYTNANILTTGSGIATVSGFGDSLLHANDGSWNMGAGGSYISQWTYTNGLTVGNYAFNGS